MSKELDRACCVRAALLQSLTSHRHIAGYSRLCHPTAKQPLQSSLLPNWDWYHVLPLTPPQFLTVNYLPFSIKYSTAFLLFARTVELSIIMLKAPIALIMSLRFHIKAADRIKNLGCPEPSCKTRICSCGCALPHITTSRHSHFVHWWRRNWRLCYCSPSFVPWRRCVVLTSVSPVANPMPGSQQTSHKCLLDEWKLNGRQRFQIYDTC